MRQLLAVCVAAALAWAGYWLWGAASIRADADAWIKDRRADGWLAEVSDITLRGFPNRFDLTLSDPTFTDPETGLGWEAPFFQLFRLSYQPSHLIAVWPATQRLYWPGGGVDISSDRLQASLVTEGEDRRLDRLTLAADVLNVAPDSGNAVAFAQTQLALRQRDDTAAGYDAVFSADGFAPNLPFSLESSATLPATFDTLRLRAVLQFDRAWDMSALNDARPQLTQIEVELAEAAWGELSLKATGTLEVDADGRPNGTLSLQARNWRDMLALARASGQVPQSVLAALEQGLTVLARLSGNSASLDLTLSFQNGRVFAGPVPLGAAPRLRLR